MNDGSSPDDREFTTRASDPEAAADATPAPPPELVPAAEALFGERLPLAIRYAELLMTEGVVRGLIGPREAPRIWDRHLLNCAVVSSLASSGASIADIGSGAGLPGIVLSVARPDLTITLIESLARRTAFLDEVVSELGLDNVTVMRGRAEECVSALPRQDYVTARAVAPLDRLAGWAIPLLQTGGHLLALKGASAVEEVAEHAAAVRRLGGDEPLIRECGVGLIEPPAIVVDVRRVSEDSGRSRASTRRAAAKERASAWEARRFGGSASGDTAGGNGGRGRSSASDRDRASQPDRRSSTDREHGRPTGRDDARSSGRDRANPTGRDARSSADRDRKTSSGRGSGGSAGRDRERSPGRDHGSWTGRDRAPSGERDRGTSGGRVPGSSTGRDGGRGRASSPASESTHRTGQGGGRSTGASPGQTRPAAEKRGSARTGRSGDPSVDSGSRRRGDDRISGQHRGAGTGVNEGFGRVRETPSGGRRPNRGEAGGAGAHRRSHEGDGEM
jgi:16S rRNA (guanine527-N7)-methyltransferase